MVVLSVHIARAVEPLIVEHGSRGSKMVALTFDACPTGKEDEYDEQVIEVLMKEKVPATLFMSGRWVEKNEVMARALAAQPQFEIANHAFRHPHMLEKDDERILQELKRTQNIIKKVTRTKPAYFRPPFGEVDERLAMLAAQAGLVTIQYDIASGDPDAGLSAKRIVRAVIADAKGGSIVVFHMNTNGPHTAEALPEVIKGLREKGFELVTVGKMLGKTDKRTGRHGDGEAGQEADKATRGPGDKGEAEEKNLHSEISLTTPMVQSDLAPSITSGGTNTAVDALPTGTVTSGGTTTAIDSLPTGTVPDQPVLP